MRVITGTAKGKKLIAPKGNEVRPTTDRIKESMFNIINPLLEGAVFVDCFAGTGSIGIEALSRGANKVYFIDDSRKSIKIIKKNLDISKFHNKSELLAVSAKKGLKILREKHSKVDIFFMDPPYSADIISSMIRKIGEFNILSDSGIIIAEHGDTLNLDREIADFLLYDTRNYGTTVMSYYKRR